MHVTRRDKSGKIQAAAPAAALILVLALVCLIAPASGAGRPQKVFEGDLYLYDIVEQKVERLTHYEDEMSIVSVDWENELAYFLGPRDKKFSLGFDGGLTALTEGATMQISALPDEPRLKVEILHNDIQVSNLDGSDRRILTGEMGFRDNALPAGEWVYYTFRSFKSTDSVLRQMRRVPVGGGAEEVLADCVAGTCVPSVEPGGGRLLVIAGSKDIDGDERIGAADLALHLLDAETQELSYLEGPAHGNQTAIWLEGGQAFYQRREHDGRTLRLIDLETGEGRDLFFLRGLPRVVYSRQTNTLIFNEDLRLMRIDVEGGKARKVEGLDYAKRIGWRPMLSWFGLNPDGTRLMIAYGREKTLSYKDYQNYRREKAAIRRDAN